MTRIKEKLAYLMGLAEGLELKQESKEGKIFNAVVEVLEEMADTMDDLSEEQQDMEKYLEALDMDLGELEAEIYEEEDEFAAEDEFFDEETDNYLEIECPNCHDIVCLEENIFKDGDLIEVTCPNCNEVVYRTHDHFCPECEAEEND